MEIVEATLALMAACIGFALVARHLRVPYAVILVLGGMALAFVPGLPHYRLDPELALAFFLPPLLQASAYRTDWRAFRADVRPILLLAVGCVVFTAFAIALFVQWLVPGMPFVAALALGAIVAPPDAVAAEAVLARLRLPRRVVTVLQGESLVNDASALVLYKLALATVAAGALSPAQGVAQFLLLGAGGVAVGYAIGRAAAWALPRLEDTLLETVLSFLACYAAYLAAEALHVSGVIAVVTGGALLGQAQHRFSGRTRLEARVVWEFVQFVLNSLVFILIGLQLNTVLARLDGSALGLVGLGAAVAAALILSRFLWLGPAYALGSAIPALRTAGDDRSWKHVAVIGWSGMRGVVSLAAALALPTDFPFRDLIVFLAFAAILGTLVVQGTTLEWLIRALHAEASAPAGGLDPEEAEGRHVAAAAALAEIEAMLADPLEGAIAADIEHEFRDRAGHLHRTAENRAAAAAERRARRILRLRALEASRSALIVHAEAGRLGTEALVRLQTELDLEELRVRQALGDERTEGEKRADRRRRELAPRTARAGGRHAGL
jgi:CPA1 family monovalent cation:H+ antiporter